MIPATKDKQVILARSLVGRLTLLSSRCQDNRLLSDALLDCATAVRHLERRRMGQPSRLSLKNWRGKILDACVVILQEAIDSEVLLTVDNGLGIDPLAVVQDIVNMIEVENFYVGSGVQMYYDSVSDKHYFRYPNGNFTSKPDPNFDPEPQAVLIDNEGIEAFFDKDVQYYIRHACDDGYWRVKDRFGQWRVVSKRRLKLSRYACKRADALRRGESHA